MNLNKFEDEELHIIKELINSQIGMKRDLRKTTSVDRMKNKLTKDILRLELLSVKVNNHLGEFE